MGVATSVPECAKRYPLLPDIDCTIGSIKPGDFPSNPAITGIGTDISFVLSAFLSLFFCTCVQVFCDRFRFDKWRRFFDPLVVSFSDQQVVRGLAMSIATLYTTSACTIDAYRYNIICYLLLMAIVSHISSVLALRSYTSGPKAIAIFRFLLIFAQVFFAGLIFSSRIPGDFPVNIPPPSLAGNTTLVLPAVCFQLADTKPYSGFEDVPQPKRRNMASFATYLILSIFYFTTILFTFAHILTYYLRPGSTILNRQEEDRAQKFTWYWWLGIFRGMILFGAWGIWIWAVIKMVKMRNWMGGSGWMSELGLEEDKGWTFGQLISIGLLGAAVLSLMNAWSGVEQKEREEKEGVTPSQSEVGGGGKVVSAGFTSYAPSYGESEVELQRLMR